MGAPAERGGEIDRWEYAERIVQRRSGIDKWEYAERIVQRILINRGRRIDLCIEIVHEACGLQPSAYVSK